MKTYIGMLGLLGLVACGGGGGGSGAGQVPTNPIDTTPPVMQPGDSNDQIGTNPPTNPGTTPIVDDPRSRDQGLSGPYSVSTVNSHGTKTNSITGNVEITPLTPSNINGATSLNIDATLSGRANAIRFATGSFDRYYSGDVTITDTATIDASDGVPSSVDFTLSGDVTTQNSGDITLTVTDTVSYGIDQDAIAVVSGETSNLTPVDEANYISDGNGPVQSFVYNNVTYTAQGSTNSGGGKEYRNESTGDVLGYASSHITWANATGITYAEPTRISVPSFFITNEATGTRDYSNAPDGSTVVYDGVTYTRQSVDGQNVRWVNADNTNQALPVNINTLENVQFNGDPSGIAYADVAAAQGSTTLTSSNAEANRAPVGSTAILRGPESMSGANDGTEYTFTKVSDTHWQLEGGTNPSTLDAQTSNGLTLISFTTPDMPMINNLGGLNGDELRTAHQQGWTGHGTYIRFNGGDQNILDNVAPGAITGEITSIPSTYQVERVGDTNTGTNIGTTVTIEGVDDPVNGAAYAGTTSLVLHKFSTLNPDQANAVVYSTAKGRGLSISRALSPVGNLR